MQYKEAESKSLRSRINSRQAVTLRLNVAIKGELRNERGKRSVIVVIVPGTLKNPYTFLCYIKHKPG